MRRKFEKFMWVVVLILLVLYVWCMKGKFTAFQVAAGFGFLVFWLLANRIIFAFLGIGRILKFEDKDFDTEARQFVYERSTLKLKDCTVLPRLEIAQIWYASIEPIKYAFYGFYVFAVALDVIFSLVLARIGEKVFMEPAAVFNQYFFHGFVTGATVVAVLVFVWDIMLVVGMTRRIIEIAKKEELEVAKASSKDN